MRSSRHFIRQFHSILLITIAWCVDGRQLLGNDFQREVQPVLAKHCFHCHGPDASTRKADLRLDTKKDLANVVSTSKDNPLGELISRVTSDDPDAVMPPPEHSTFLSSEEKQALISWVKNGAVWNPHWSFISPTKPQAPSIQASSTIDKFVEAKLQEKQLTPMLRATREELLRRVSLDLTGMVPSLEITKEFLSDSDPLSYERLVDRFLQSPAYGEHRARYWLDAVRYADTHGLHFDNYREIWPYRDWVIQAFNRNQPFDEFTIEQIAGDLLPNPTLSQRIATGFQRCNMTTNEGGTIDEENLAIYAADRVQTLGWTFLGLSINCAQCHDHKFDPISIRDYYALSAFFQNTTQPPKDGNVKANGATALMIRDSDVSAHAKLMANVKESKSILKQQEKEILPVEIPTNPEEQLREFSQKSTKQGLVFHAPFHSESKSYPNTNFNALEGIFGKSHSFKKVIALNDIPPPQLSPSKPFSISLWIKPNELTRNQTVVSSMDSKLKLRGWDIFLQRDQLVVHLIDEWPKKAIRVMTTTGVLLPKAWHHILVTHQGDASAKSLTVYVDGVKKDLKILNDSLGKNASLDAQSPVVLGGRATAQLFTDGMLQDLRIYDRVLFLDEIQQLHVSGKLAKPITDHRTISAQVPAPNPDLLKTWSRLTYHPAYVSALRELQQKQNELSLLESNNPVTLVQEEIPHKMPSAAILLRGQYDQRGEVVEANVPSSIMPLPADAPKNRLGLAQWLTHPNHPLVSRVIVNRFWQEIFGTGLVSSSDDFGLMGQQPSHPELLDWLARSFVDSGWNVKELIRKMVLSEAYQRSAAANPAQRASDPDNRWLSRGPRFRMDAEMIRDSALHASGLLASTIGGPGTKPVQPDNLWNVVGLPGGDTREYVTDTDDNRFRRSVYHFWKRMSPPPNLETFNAPARETSCVRRDRTNTPLQALVLLNDPQWVQAAIHLASNCVNQTDPIASMSQRTLQRALTQVESESLHQLYQEALQHFVEHPQALEVWLGYDSELKDTPTPPLGALAMVAQQFLNLDEFISK